jgi:hypothetical protein
MRRRTVEANNLIYNFSPDDPPASGNRVWALVSARVVDEITGHPVVDPIALESDLPSVLARVATDGLVGLEGIPLQVFPGLKSQDYKVTLKIRAIGYVPRDVIFTIEQTKNSNFPADFTPPLAVEVDLHHDPVVITGRVMLQATNGMKTPLPGATVRIKKIWRTAPPANMSTPPEATRLVSLGSPLYSDRTSSSANVFKQNLTEVLGDDKLLLDDCMAGAQKIRLSNGLNFVPPPPSGNILLIDAGQPDIAEYLAVNSISGTGTPDQPATIILDYPLAYSHRRNAVVRRVIPQPQGAAIPFTHDAIVGDTCIFLNSFMGLTTGNQIRIKGGGLPDEFHRVSLFSTSSDADGYYRLPFLARVSQITLSAKQGALTPVSVEFRPNYSLRENWLDFVLR